QDPDVILVGELRDVETFDAAIHAAETGHLVFGTIHAASAPTTINRILDLFPPEKHQGIRQALANNLKAIVAQKLVKGLKKGRVPTNEIMIVNPIVKKLISEGKDNSLQDAIRMCFQEGMVDFTENLRQLVEREDIDKATALEIAPNPEQLQMALKGIKVAAPGIL
ncbi:MAG TPA: ATPase, T2SS/T4P/T4SS family, partial [Gemmataceae bacterium]|nr:ATPase, T2SS/T4P/T4SS family [Gemmataceae bacterium]